MADGWNDEYVEKLKKLWSEGLSASQIAERLGTVTRNAVIGKVHRLGLSGRATNRVHRAPQKRKPTPKPPRKPVRIPTPLEVLFKVEDPMIPVEEIFIPLDKRKGVLQLEDGDCRFPIGDPREEGFHFCGHPKAIGLSYCRTHTLRCHQPPKMPAIRAGVTAGADSCASGRSGTPEPANASSGLPERKLETAE